MKPAENLYVSTGAGYHLVLVKQEDCDVEAVTNLIFHHIPNARLESNVSAELTFGLPHESKEHFQVKHSHNIHSVG